VPSPTKASINHNLRRDLGLPGASSDDFSLASGKLFPLNHSDQSASRKDQDLQMKKTDESDYSFLSEL
jgi:hypothetical protein